MFLRRFIGYKLLQDNISAYVVAKKKTKNVTRYEYKQMFQKFRIWKGVNLKYI